MMTKKDRETVKRPGAEKKTSGKRPGQQREERDGKELELYLHIPFCVQKCAYCDFLSAPAGEREREEYVAALIQEIQRAGASYRLRPVSTVFMGGGTPSILTPAQIKEIFGTLRENFSIAEDAEITIEANPDTVTEEKAESWKAAGIDRVSIGLQSADDRELKLLGRIHDLQRFLDAYRTVRAAGFSNVNIDLISGLPGQKVSDWEYTLRTAAELEPEHLSAYSLIVEEGTPFFARYKDIDADEETDRAIYHATAQILKEYGFFRYEISNYAREGRKCRHNIGYWTRKDYLGLGLGASSLIGHTRFHNTAEMAAYLRGVRGNGDIRRDIEKLSQKDEMEEFMFLGLRMTDGISKEEFFRCFGKTAEEVYKAPLLELEKDGLLEIDSDRIRPTERGLDLNNYVCGKFMF